MNWSTIKSLASVLFKSYFRASRFGRRSILSNPYLIVGLDIVAFAIPFGLLTYALPLVPAKLASSIRPVAINALIVLPVLLTSALILAGILFELGQVTGLSSSEAVNWLPVSPREYVVASTLSMVFTYSVILFLGLGATIPLAVYLGMLSVLPLFISVSVLAFFLGAVMVEVLRSVMNRISTTLYKKSGRLGVILRIVLAVAVFVVLDIALNPYILYVALSGIVAGVNLAWFIPVLWPSAAIAFFFSSDATTTALLALLSVFFVFLISEGATRLRAKYWSPVPVTITLSASTVYVPQGRSFLWLDPIAFAVASKELRSLARRREMSRFLAIPVIFVVASLIPTLTSSSAKGSAHSSLASVILYILAEISFLLPMILSSISIGQEGRSIANIYMLPISTDELVLGKLFFPWVLSSVGILTISLLWQFLAPLTIGQFFVALVFAAFNLIAQGYLGLGVGSRYPSFDAGPRPRYISPVGFLIEFVMGGLAMLAILTPLILYFWTSLLTGLGGGPIVSALLTMIMTAAVGTLVIALARNYCNQGIKKLFSSLEA